jgi:hypothetical protein
VFQLGNVLVQKVNTVKKDVWRRCGAAEEGKSEKGGKFKRLMRFFRVKLCEEVRGGFMQSCKMKMSWI